MERSSYDIGLSVTISFGSFKAHLISYYNQSLCKSLTLKILAHLSLPARVATKPVNWQETLIVATNYSLIFIAIFISILCVPGLQ